MIEFTIIGIGAIFLIGIIMGFGIGYWIGKYSASDKIASKIAEKIFPYVIEKKKQIACLLNLRNHKELPRKKGGISNRTMHPSFLKYRENLYITVKSLNNRIKVAIPEMPQEVIK